jgi:predicted RNA-binding protein with PUA-like domain
MAHWLLKTEPEEWSWRKQTNVSAAPWDGVRNHQAAGFMRKMKQGEFGFFYHTGTERRIVGVVEVMREFYPDPKDETGRFGIVDVRAVMPLMRAVELKQIKAEPLLGHLLLVRNSRLSIMPVDAAGWRIICRMGGITL